MSLPTLPDDIRDEIVRRLSDAKARAGIGVRDLCRQIGVHPQTWYSYTTGRVTPSLATLHAFAVVLGITLRDLMPDASDSRRDNLNSSQPRP